MWRHCLERLMVAHLLPTVSSMGTLSKARACAATPIPCPAPTLRRPPRDRSAEAKPSVTSWWGTLLRSHPRLKKLTAPTHLEASAERLQHGRKAQRDLVVERDVIDQRHAHAAR